ncbi:hypothetical protein GALMADRAFT_238526 [Galerina marginata CBS 339.88]|uniref:Superoxide dismutase [Cu-Zn] n=1 Tax=Galerina marginata (strain CBS 339.88) TaxID=685588 RepID=A0A067TI43_GALM3|nr:hypothetical protein GALMADRAFT_238526 [Galerina marginata CBS 339.88]
MDSYNKAPIKQKSSVRPILVLTLTAFFVSVFVLYNKLFIQGSPIQSTSAVVVLRGDSSVTGTVTFRQRSKGPVTISGKIQGLSPNALRGFHVHQLGDLSGGCLSAGSHFNPYGKTHGPPTASTRHVGDLGNIKTDENGEANFEFTDHLISLQGPNSIIGRSVVVHAGTDDLGAGGDDESLKTGNAGARAACGVIGLA